MSELRYERLLRDADQRNRELSYFMARDDEPTPWRAPLDEQLEAVAGMLWDALRRESWEAVADCAIRVARITARIQYLMEPKPSRKE